MSRERPAHARSSGGGRSGEGPPGDETGGAPPGSPLAVALRDLRPPRHDPDFWTDLDTRLADEPQLRLAPRSAIRPITQPPPVIDDGSLASSLSGPELTPPRRRSGRRTAVAAVAALLVALLVLAALGAPDDDTTTTDTTATTTGRTPTSDESAPPTDAAPETTTPPGAIDPAAPLTPAGVGPLRIGATLGELQMEGVQVQIDQGTFDTSGGACYDAKVPGSLDLSLRFRAPDGQAGVEDPNQGVLTTVAVESGLPTGRGTDSGLALGAPQDQVLGAYGGNLDETSHPFVAGGRIFRADNGDGTGIAFFTDGVGLIRIAVGHMDSIRFLNQCR